ncbi:MAG: hypothetical protein JJV97_06105 [SAR324 cluster bacterium]|nr:hypothetical protein [SAR324 cluster bacterium]
MSKPISKKHTNKIAVTKKDTITRVKIIQELAKIAFLAPDNSLLESLEKSDLKSIDPDLWKAASKIEILKNKDQLKVKINFYDKLSALKKLSAMLETEAIDKIDKKKCANEIILNIDYK